MPAPPRPDDRPHRVYTRDPATGLLIHDGLIYRGARCAQRQARTISRVLGRHAEARPVVEPA
jgi:hypothetical protein